MPTNALIWLGVESCSDAYSDHRRLVDAIGGEVPVTRTCLLSGFFDETMAVLHPQVELQPNAAYTVEGWGEALRFTTGEAADHTPPALPELLEVDVERGAITCDTGRASVASLSLQADGVVFLLDADEMADLDPSTLDGFVVGLSDDPGGLQLGERPGCGGAGNFSGKRAQVRFGALDLAGNFSGWTEPESVSLTGCGCRAGTGTPSLLPLVVLLGWRRRARDRS